MKQSIEHLGFQLYNADRREVARAAMEWLARAKTEWFAISDDEVSVVYLYDESVGSLVGWLDRRFKRYEPDN